MMIRSLVEAGVLFEDAIYPRQKHGFRADSQRHFYRRMTEFFERSLAARPSSSRRPPGSSPRP